VYTLVLAVIAAAVPVIACTGFHDRLPQIMQGNDDAPAKLVVAFVTWCIGIGALVTLWRRRSRTVLDLWLMVVMCVWIADTALSAVLNHARFDVGWYAGRVYGLLANGFVLGVLLLESGTLYARLARSNRLLGNALVEMRRLNGDLQAFAGSLAHDLQQPLVTIASFAQVIQKSPLDERDAAHLRKIIGATETAREMIRALLEFARLGESELDSEPVELDKLVQQARQAVAACAQGREIEWDIAPLPVVHGDASLLLLVFINLLSNP
jgi:signal transduction histidine kinase